MDRYRASMAPTVVTAPPRRAGVVRWFCAERGFGFVVPEDGSEDVFVTFDALPGDGFRSLTDGQRITFVRSCDDHGPTARDVRLEG